MANGLWDPVLSLSALASSLSSLPPPPSYRDGDVRGLLGVDERPHLERALAAVAGVVVLGGRGDGRRDGFRRREIQILLRPPLRVSLLLGVNSIEHFWLEF